MFLTISCIFELLSFLVKFFFNFSVSMLAESTHTSENLILAPMCPSIVLDWLHPCCFPPSVWIMFPMSKSSMYPAVFPTSPASPRAGIYLADARCCLLPTLWRSIITPFSHKTRHGLQVGLPSD